MLPSSFRGIFSKIIDSNWFVFDPVVGSLGLLLQIALDRAIDRVVVDYLLRSCAPLLQYLGARRLYASAPLLPDIRLWFAARI